MQELVSVILTTYNRKRTIVRAIESILNQTWQNIELIIVDDASTDGTFDMVAELYGEDERVTYIINDANMGPSGARNAGVDAAKGNWIAFQDSDDEWHPDKLEKQMSLVAEHACGGVYSQIKRYRKSGQVELWPPDSVPMEVKLGKIHKHVLLSPLCSTQTLLLSKECFVAAGGFAEDMRALEDYEFSIRFSRDYDVLLYDEPLVDVYESEDSIINKGFDEAIRVQCLIMDKYRGDLSEYGLKKVKLQNVWTAAAVFGNLHILEDNIKILLDDDVYEETFMNLEEQRRQGIFQLCERKIGIFLDDANVTFGDGTRPERGEIGIDGSEYDMLLLIRYLSMSGQKNAVTVYHLNENNLLPWEARSVIVDDKYKAIGLGEREQQDIFVFILEPDQKWYHELSRHKLRCVCWQTAYTEYIDSELSDILLECETIEKIVCVSESMYSHYDSWDIQRKMCGLRIIEWNDLLDSMMDKTENEDMVNKK